MDDIASAIHHFDALASLAKRLSASRLAVFEHEYYSLHFGSWTIVAGRRHTRFRFLWDGREGMLTVERAAKSNPALPIRWEPVRTETIPLERARDAFEIVARFLEDAFQA